MSEGKRPGGLTALAVINFVAAAYDLLQLMFYGMMFTAHHSVTVREALLTQYEKNPAMQTVLETFISNPQYTGTMALFFLLLAATLVSSGIGYLLQRRRLGRAVGSAYAFLSLGSLV
jgi:hypothetical protein